MVAIPLLILLLLLAYLSGSIPCGLLLTRHLNGIDIRAAGSGNIGATNVRRTAGNLFGLLTLAGDVGKAALPTLLAGIACPPGPHRETLMATVGFCAFLGHLFPVYLKGRDGGKGVASAGGVFGVISVGGLLASLGIFVLVLALTRRVSAGSLAASVSLPLFVWWWTRHPGPVVVALAVALLILVRHRENIQRLRRGTEPPLWGA
jgi:glycerol-3-phosphate acyltransferase PlsY